MTNRQMSLRFHKASQSQDKQARRRPLQKQSQNSQEKHGKKIQIPQKSMYNIKSSYLLAKCQHNQRMKVLVNLQAQEMLCERQRLRGGLREQSESFKRSFEDKLDGHGKGKRATHY